jgi:hypothetical protein
MADGTWDDFTSRGGFADGAASLSDIDYRARNLLVTKINERLEKTTCTYRAFAYNRPGMHNGLMILFAHKECPEDTGQWKSSQFETVLQARNRPPELDEQLEVESEANDYTGAGTCEELADEAYREAHDCFYIVEREIVDKLVEAVDSYLAGDGSDKDAQDALGVACDALKGKL